MLPPPQQGAPTTPTLPLGGSWASYCLLGLPPWVLAGMGEGGGEGTAPSTPARVICLFFRPLPICPSLT